MNATPFADRLDPGQLERIMEDSHKVLEQSRGGDGLVLPLTGSLLVATPGTVR